MPASVALPDPRVFASAVNAILSLSVIALNIVYITPTLCRVTIGRNRFRPGPFTLGKWIYPVAFLGALWVGFAVCIFSLPQVYPSAYAGRRGMRAARSSHPADAACAARLQSTTAR